MEVPELLVGVDWAKDAHQVCVMNRRQEVLHEGEVEHSGAAIAQFAETLSRLADGDHSKVAIAIEIPRGALVECFVERGFRVFAINPKQADRFRDRYFPAGSKDDSRDAYVLADSLRTDLHCFREVRLDDPLIVQIREHVRMDDDLRGEANRLGNRLRDLLHRYFPQVLKISPSGDEPWVLDLLERTPTPMRARQLRKKTVAGILRARRIRRLTADEVIDALTVPDVELADGTVAAAAAHVSLLIPRIRLVAVQRKQVKKRLELLLQSIEHGPDQDESSPEGREHRDVEILLSMPGIGTTVAATMLAEAAWPLAERDYHAMRAHAGIAPITVASGKKKGNRARVSMRHACNGRLRNAVYHWSRVASQHDPRTKAHYAALRAKGHSHGRALRGVADRLLRILFAMLGGGTLFDPTHQRRPVPAAAEAA